MVYNGRSSRDDRRLRAWYLSLNRRYFHEQLPADLPVRFGTIHQKHAACTFFDESGCATEIAIDKYLKPLLRYAQIVLLHEMCHVAVGNQERAYHGALWMRERKRLIDAGAFTALL